MLPIQTQDDAIFTDLPVAQRVLAGRRTVVFNLPFSFRQKFALDVTSFSNSVQLERVSFRFLGLRKSIKLKSISINSEGPRKPVILSIRMPTQVILLSTLPWLIAAAFLVAVFKLWPRQLTDHEKSTPLAIAWVALCFTIFVYQVIWKSAWLPLSDDWRYYSDGAFSLINGRFEWLHISNNSTYFLTGQIFDWIILKIGNGNFLFIRLFALLALAGFLSFSTALLLNYSRHFTAAGLTFLSLSMSSSAYWGRAGIAYHQMLPVLFFYWCLWKLTKISQLKQTPFLSLTFLTFAAGLAYISGPFLFVALIISAIIFWTLQALKHRTLAPPTASLVTEQWWPALQTLSTFGVLTLLIQLSMVMSQQENIPGHTHPFALTFPTEIRYWEFLTALYGRIAGIPEMPIALDFLAFALVLACMLRLVLIAYKHQLNNHNTQALIIALACGIGGLLYALIVSAGRTGAAPKDASSWVEIAAFARSRFHYWWLTALLPIFFALSFDLFSWNQIFRRRLSITLIFFFLIVKSIHMLYLDPRQFDIAKKRELNGTDCVRSRWTEAQKDKSKRYDCPEFYPTILNDFIRIPIKESMLPASQLFQSSITTNNQ